MALRPHYLPPLYQDSPKSGRLILRDGSVALIRIAQKQDAPLLQKLFGHLSPESRWSRFLSPAVPDAKWVQSLCDPSHPEKSLTLLVTRTVDSNTRAIAQASYWLMEKGSAEVAFTVEDEFQGKGIGSLLLERLAVLAASHGIRRFWAMTHPQNHRMIEVFRNSGFQLHEKQDVGSVEIDFSVVPTKESMARSEMLDSVFTSASLRPFFLPSSIALVGASRDPKNIGRTLLKALHSSFRGKLYLVNPKVSRLLSLRCYPAVTAIPHPVDLAIIAVRRDQILKVIDDCCQKSVKAVVIVSSGFAESGEEGKKLQDKLTQKVRECGMRLIGPNSLGVMNTDRQRGLNAIAAGLTAPRGRVAVSSQSGGLGVVALQLARQRNLGLSMFVSIGNKADVSGNDLLTYWEQDPMTDVILLYLESFGNPRRFGRIARRVGRAKPVVVVKGRVGENGDAAVGALFRQSGVVRADSIEEMFDCAMVFANQPLPLGRRIAIVSNAAGPAFLCADICRSGGLILPSIPRVPNPLDLTGFAGPKEYRKAIEAMLLQDGIDSLILLYTPLLIRNEKEVLQTIRSVLSSRKNRRVKTVLACFMGSELPRKNLVTGKERIPLFPFPERAARALTKVTEYAEWRREPAGMIPELEDISPRDAAHIIDSASSGKLSKDRTVALLRSMNLPVIQPDQESTNVLEVKIAVSQDPLFGPLLTFGVSGLPVELLGDRSFRIAPITDLDASRMIREIKAFPMLNGYGGRAPGDIRALEDLLLRVSRLLEEAPDIEQLELNPVVVYPSGKGCAIVNAEVIVRH